MCWGAVRAGSSARAAKPEAERHDQEARLGSHWQGIGNGNQQLRVRISSGDGDKGEPPPGELPASP